MIVNGAVSGLLALIAGYLIGSFPSAYVITRLARGKDIRTLGTGHTGKGNVGARNVFVNVGKVPGAVVAVLDILKGVLAVLVARLLVGSPEGLSQIEQRTAALFVLGAGLAAVIGHIWPVYIKFRGGAGLATAIGILVIVLPRELLLALSIALILIVTTRNVILSVNLSLLSVPVWAWLFDRPWYMVFYPLVVLAVMFVNFLPNIVAETKKAGSADNLIAGLTRRRKAK